MAPQTCRPEFRFHHCSQTLGDGAASLSSLCMGRDTGSLEQAGSKSHQIRPPGSVDEVDSIRGKHLIVHL